MHFTTAIAFLILILAVGGPLAQANPAGLTRCSSREVVTPVNGLLASDQENIYLSSANGTLTSYEAGHLGIMWRLELGGEFASEILLIGNGLIVATNSTAGTQEGSTVRSIGRDSGVTAWSAKLPYSEKYYLGRLNGGVAAVSRQGVVILLDAASGQVKWQAGPYGRVNAAPSFTPGRVVLGTADRRIVVVSAANGDVASKLQTDFVPTAISFSQNGGILAGDERGNVVLLGPQDHKPVWRFKSGAAVSSVAAIDDGILITSLDNFVYLISDYNGDVIWKRRLPGRVVEGGLRLNGYLIVLVYGENSGYVLDLENGKVADVISSNEKDMISRSSVFVRDKTFALIAGNSLETYAIGGCNSR